MKINLNNLLGSIIYIQIWHNRIKAINLTTNQFFDEKPLISVETDEKGKRRIDAVGNNAAFSTKENIETINPFFSKDSIVSNYEMGEKLLQHIITHLMKGRIFAVRPRIVIHPRDVDEKEVTDSDKRALTEMTTAAGAREVIVYVGKELPIFDFDYDNIKRLQNKP